jgi:hypothetical protein
MMIATFRARFPREGLLGMGFGAALVYLVFFGIYLPRAGFLHLSKRTADVLIQHGATGAGQVEMLDYKEPSLAFYQGGTIREAEGLWLSSRFFDQLPPWLVITAEMWDKASPELKEKFEVVHTRRGWAYANRNRIVDVMIIRKK